ncbi:polytopic membrane protein [Aspergillus nomiae NRRL 13137]|uniref:Polytopic membrane protein n=1 Tax=Aspergillus nomiae NRRL (strain ATCC 15546 / NRRL 13137 / CBS 260.88 / M93) TaxID=1509407 RepID=A0A0L1J7F9_ASPN3|nr:polytopic membrane protein [Aspergillus nomiae NRRL 13137]KNG87677.1 polytopic membrane protein [Aspergillus nomiae NRRL 13137]
MAEDRSLEVRAVAAVFLALATVATALRCYVRLAIVKAFGWDDAIMLLALGFFGMFSGCMIGGSLYGTGRHLTELTNDQRTTAMEYWFLCDVAYCLSSILCKISVGIFLLRVTVHKVHRMVVYAVTTLAVVFGLMFLILLLAQCKPVKFFWMRLSTENPVSGSCINMTVIIVALYIFSAVSFIFDLTVGVLPVFVVRNLQMRRDLKYAVAGLLGMACIASVAVLVRMAYVETLRDPDFLYATVGIAVWSNIETGLGIFAGSLATLRPLLRMIRPGTGRSYNKNTPSTPGSRTWHNSSFQRSNALPLSSLTTEEERQHRLKGNVRAGTPIEAGPGMSSSSVATEDDISDHELILPKDSADYQYQINVRRDFHITSSESPV